MTYTVAKTLHIRPREILFNWTCEELLVAFGVYVNDIMAQKYAEFESLDSTTKSKIKKSDRPQEYAIRFITFDQWEELTRPKSDQELQAEREEEMRMKAFLEGAGRNLF